MRSGTGSGGNAVPLPVVESAPIHEALSYLSIDGRGESFTAAASPFFTPPPGTGEGGCGAVLLKREFLSLSRPVVLRSQVLVSSPLQSAPN